jgi:hypothetical protein
MQAAVQASHCNGKLFLPTPEHSVPRHRPWGRTAPARFSIGGAHTANGPKLRFTKSRQKVTILEWNGAVRMGIAMSRAPISGPAQPPAGRERMRQRSVSSGLPGVARSSRLGWR